MGVYGKPAPFHMNGKVNLAKSGAGVEKAIAKDRYTFAEFVDDLDVNFHAAIFYLGRHILGFGVLFICLFLWYIFFSFII